MTYAPAGRAIYDADSHIMELPDFLKALRRPGPARRHPRGELRGLDRHRRGGGGDHGAGRAPQRRARRRADRAGRRADRSPRRRSRRWAPSRAPTARRRWTCWASGSSWCSPPTASPCRSRPAPSSTRSCATARRAPTTGTWPTSARATTRLMGVAVVPLDEPELAMAELDFVLESGLEAVWVPHRPCGERSPGHVDFDPFWARLWPRAARRSCCTSAARRCSSPRPG